MNKNRSRIFSLVVGLCAGCSISQASERTPIVVEIVEAGQFEVIHSRAEKMVLNLPYSLLHNVGRESTDEKLEAEIAPVANDPGCVAGFADVIRDCLASKGVDARIVIGSEDPESQYDTVADVEVEVRACGFMVIDRESELLAAFHEASYRIRRQDGEITDPATILIAGADRWTWEIMSSNPGSALQAFDRAKARAGRRIADKIFYAPHD